MYVSNLNGTAWERRANPLRKYVGSERVMEPTTLEAAEEMCLWDWYDVENAREVPCTSLSTFYLFLTDKKTEIVKVSGADIKKGSATVTCFGPLCDDANYTQENEGRLRASFLLTKKELHDEVIGLSEEELLKVHKAVRDNIKGNLSLDVFATTLGLRRVQ